MVTVFFGRTHFQSRLYSLYTIAVEGKDRREKGSLVNGTNDREAYPKRWIAVLVQVNCEKRTATRLRKEGYETYIPTQQEVHQCSDRKKKVDRLIMPMVVFVRASLREEEWLRNHSFTDSWRFRVAMKIIKGLLPLSPTTRSRD